MAEFPSTGRAVIVDPPSSGDATSMLIAAAAKSLTLGIPYGGAVYMNAGAYSVSGLIGAGNTLDGVRFVGAGKNSSVFKKTANIATAMLDFSGNSNADRCQRGGLMDVRLDGAGFTGPLVRAKWADHLNFDRVFCFNNSDQAVYLENCWDTYFNNVEFDTCSGIDGFKPSVLISSNADDSSNIIVFNECRWENFKDGSLWVSTAPIVSAYTMVAGSNPAYGIYLQNCKMETPQLRGLLVNMSADVSSLHIDGMYVAARGLYTGISTGRTIFSMIGANDLVLRNLHVLINGVTNPTASSVFSWNTNARACVQEDIYLDIQQNPSVAVTTIAGGAPDLRYANVTPKVGQTPTMFSGTWPPQVASAATITLPRNPGVVVISGTTTITGITAQDPGRQVTLQFLGSLTLTNGATIKLAGAANFAATADDTITLISDGTNWRETGRSVN